MLCVTITIVYSDRSSCIRSSIRCVAIGSSAEHGSSIRITSGPRRDRPGDAQALLLPARERQPGLLELVLDLVPQRRPAERLLDQLVHVALEAGDLADRRRCCRRSTWGTGSASGTPCRSAGGPRPGRPARVVEVDAVVQQRPLDPGALDQVVHPVQAADERRLAAAGRADQRRDLVAVDRQRHVADGPEVPVVDGQVANVEHDLRLGLGRPGLAVEAHRHRVRSSAVSVGSPSARPVGNVGHVGRLHPVTTFAHSGSSTGWRRSSPRGSRPGAR